MPSVTERRTITGPGCTIAAIAQKHGVDLEAIARDDAVTLSLHLLKPSLGTLSIVEENPTIVSVYHHPPAVTLGYVGVIWNAEDFVLREMDLMLTEQGNWLPIHYRSGDYCTKHPPELRYLVEAWEEMLEIEDWYSADVVELSIKRQESSTKEPAVHTASALRPHRGSIWNW